MLKVVIDTNVLVSALLKSGSVPASGTVVHSWEKADPVSFSSDCHGI
jgi:predicted nucleic acid-binding protein